MFLFVLPRMELLEEALKTPEVLKNNRQAMGKYMNSFDTIIKTVKSNEIHGEMLASPESRFFLLPLYIGSLFFERKYEEIYKCLENEDLGGAEYYCDFFNSKLIKYLYLSSKYLKRTMYDLHTLLAVNRERENKQSVSVLKNCILDAQINKNVLYTADETEDGVTEEAARHSFYLGYIKLIKGDYAEARRFFGHAEVVTRSRSLTKVIKKCVIVCKILLGDHNISYKFEESLRPYFLLMDSVKQGDSSYFDRILETYIDEFFSLNLYFVVRRCIRNLLLEGLRKVSICYSRISVEEINRVLDTRADHLLNFAVQEGLVNGRVENGIFYGSTKAAPITSFVEDICEAIDMRKTLNSKMKYPEIPLLTYESVMEAEKKSE